MKKDLRQATVSILGANFIERHFTLSKAMAGFDHGISMEPSEFKEMSLLIKNVIQQEALKKKY